MVASPRLFFIVICSIGMIFWLYLFLGVTRPEPTSSMEGTINKMSYAIYSLKEQVRQETEELLRLKKTVNDLSLSKFPVKDTDIHSPKLQPWPEPIPVLVFVCNRSAAVLGILRKLISLRPSKEKFPIVVSQDCDDVPVQRAVAGFRDQVSYIKHKSAQQDRVAVPKEHKKYAAYYYIARHYKLALSHIFDTLKYNTAILLEDDLDIADDFFEYFSGTRYLLDKDPQLWCVSAWNDNGKGDVIDTSANSLLYRSDFFPGLGWMMTRRTWLEIGPKWPPGFWDDWMREPETRKGRHCIRPEISRTMMTAFGKKGASKGQFFKKHLAKIIMNTVPVAFTTKNLDYLLLPAYDKQFNRMVYEDSILVNINDVNATIAGETYKNLRVEYTGNIDFIMKADRLHIMHDFKAGVPRTAYRGVVTAFINGVRIFLVPDRKSVKGYDKSWKVPAKFGE